jgi:hypothetical protein
MGNQTHFQGALITVQVKVTMIIPPSYPLSSFESMHSQVQDSKTMSKTFFEKFDAVSAMMHKRSQWLRWHKSFTRTKVEGW